MISYYVYLMDIIKIMDIMISLSTVHRLKYIRDIKLVKYSIKLSHHLLHSIAKGIQSNYNNKKHYILIN